MIFNIKKYFTNYVIIFAKIIFNWLLILFNHSNHRNNKVLIVQIAGIGDMVMCNSILSEARKIYPDKHIVYLVKDTHALLVQNCPFIDEIIEYPEMAIRKNLRVRWNFFSKIIKSGFEIVIYPYRSRTISVEEVVFMTEAIEIISYEGDPLAIDHLGKNRNKYTRLFPHNEEALHELETHRLFMEWLGGTTVSAMWPAVWTDEIDSRVQLKFNDILGFDVIQDQYIVFFPGALSSMRIWPVENYIEVGRKFLNQFPHLSIVICGGAAEKYLANEICRQLPGQVVDFTGKTDLSELVYILKNAELYLGSETGTYHLSVALNIPSICILGGGHWGRFVPYPEFSPKINREVYINMDCYGCNWRCPHSRPCCINNIQPCNVWKEILIAMKKNDFVLSQ